MHPGVSRQMYTEWQAWRSICRELNKLGVDVNQAKPLVNALKRWGEEVAALRAEQDPDIVADALAEYRKGYPTLVQD